MDLFDKLTPHTTIITPNRRLSATLIKSYESNQIKKAKTSWPTPDILPFNSFITRLYQEYTVATISEQHPILLTSEQQRILFDVIIKQSPLHDSLIQLSETAELARSAWTVMKQWQVTHDNPLFTMTEDSLTYQTWAKHYQQLCENRHWLDDSMVIDWLTDKIQQGLIQLPKQLIALGFTELTPQQHYFFKQCERSGCQTVLSQKVKQRNQRTERISLLTEEAELSIMAQWAKALHNANPQQTIGCVIPNLDKIRDQVITIFSELFSPSDQLTLDYTTLPFNISAGKNLYSYPVIHSAFLILGLHNNTIHYDSLRRLLRSPFIMQAERELILRARCENALKKTGQTTYSLAACKKIVEQASSILASAIAELENYFNQLPARAPIHQWIQHIMHILHLLGWPGERSVNSEEYQVIQRFLTSLQNYSTYQILFEELTYHDALHYLILLTQNTIFQPQSPEAPIQILGLLEAADIPFDHLWIMGLDDTHFPPSAKPNPFIPYPLQKELNMPHATAERELAYSKRILEQLTQGSQFCIVSHAKKANDAELRASQLIQSFSEMTPETLALAPTKTRTEHIYENTDIETIHDELGPIIQENEHIRGGVSILKQQAACPFKAFAEIRLHAKPADSIRLGLRPEERGQIVHTALELIWQSMTESNQLNQLASDDLKTLVLDCATSAIEKTTQQPVHQLRYHELELTRLTNLLLDWLTIEKNRPAFKVIACEKEQTISIGKLAISIRVDRVDELDDGSQIIIDYKTGKHNSIQSFFGERLDEPQLPLYCIKSTHPINGIAFAELNRSTLQLKGIASHDIGISSIKPIANWQEQLVQWNILLENTAEQFYHGHAEIDPKYPIETCQYCQLQGLCRKHEFVEDHHE